MGRDSATAGDANRPVGLRESARESGGREARLFLTAVAVNAVLFAIALTCLTLGYETNDDMRMASIASGVTTGQPSQEIIVSNVLIGAALKHLYQWTDAVNWYSLYLLGVQFATMTGLLYAFLRVRPSRLSVALFVLLFAQFEVGLLLLLQFTSTASMACLVGVLLVMASSTEERGQSRFALAYGALLIVVSILIRVESLYYALVLLAPFFAYQLAFRRRWRAYAQIAAIVAVSFTLVGYDAWHYARDPSWRSFREYNALVRRLVDSPLADYESSTRFFFDRIGFSDNDWSTFMSLFIADEQVFSTDRLKAVADRFEGSSWGRRDSREYFDERMSALMAFRRMMYANVALAVLLCSGLRMRLFVLGAVGCVLVETLLAALAVYAKLAPRVILPAFAMVDILVFYELLQTVSERRFLTGPPPVSGRIRVASAAGAAAFCLVYAACSYRVEAQHLTASESNAGGQRALAAVERQIVGRYVDRNSKTVFLDWAGTFPVQFTSPFDDLRTLRRFNLLTLDGWGIKNPQFDKRVAQLRLGNLCRALYENPDVQLIAPPYNLKWLRGFAREHFQQKIFSAQNDAFLVDTDFLSTAVGNLEVHVYKMAPGTSPRDHPSSQADAAAQRDTQQIATLRASVYARERFNKQHAFKSRAR